MKNNRMSDKYLEAEAKDVLEQSGNAKFLPDDRTQEPGHTFDDENPEQIENRYLQQGDWDDDAEMRITPEGELRKFDK